MLLFRDDADIVAYRVLLEQMRKQFDIEVLEFCPMSTHLHIVLKPNSQENFVRFFHRLHTYYARYYNQRYDRSGPVFAGRPRSTVIDTGNYLWNAMRYVELNPVKAGIAKQPCDYAWSGAQWHFHKTQVTPEISYDDETFHSRWTTEDWALFVTQRVVSGPEEAKFERVIKLGGKGYGSQAFLEEMTVRAGYPLMMCKPGRRKKGDNKHRYMWPEPLQTPVASAGSG